MNDDNWELIGGPVAQEIEFLNYLNQTNVLEGLVRFLLAHQGPMGDGKAPMPDDQALCNLHHAGTLFLLADPGHYRMCKVEIKKGDVVVHTPPDWHNVKGFMQHFFRDLSSIWSSADALDVAAYALWRINWVHPFRNGNGRTARAFCYACMCLKLGAWLSGRKTVPDLIMDNRDRYEESLRRADEGLATPPHRPNLAPMRAFLDDLLQDQMASRFLNSPFVPQPPQGPAPPAA
jgi:Fic family protein